MDGAKATTADAKDTSGDQDVQNPAETVLECAVCLQPSIHPVKLPCDHIFCFLCVKGVTIQSRRCPMCRREIPPGYLDHPTLVKDDPLLGGAAALVEDSNGPGTETSEVDDEEEYQWFYQGRNGWWKYDERTAEELESHFKKGEQHCELLIAGFLYCIDFEGMFQCRRNEPQRRRTIRRDLASNVSDKKGVAGLRIGGGGAREEPRDAHQAPDSSVRLANQMRDLSLDNSDRLRGPNPAPIQRPAQVQAQRSLEAMARNTLDRLLNDDEEEDDT